MDTHQRGPLLNWNYSLYQEKSSSSMDELRQSLVVAMEIEEIRVKAEEEVRVRDLEIAQLKELLCAAIKERDEAQHNCRQARYQHALLMQKRQHQLSAAAAAPHSGVSSSVEDFASCDEKSIGSSPPPMPEHEIPVAPSMPLPEKGKLLEAVVRAGPLLQTLLISGGPLPRWRHPPPQLDTCQIPPPPVGIHIQHGNHNSNNSCGGNATRKRAHQ